MMRNLQNTKVQSNVQYHGDLLKKIQQEANRPKEELTDAPSAGAYYLHMGLRLISAVRAFSIS